MIYGDAYISTEIELICKEKNILHAVRTQTYLQRLLREDHEIIMFVEPFVAGYRWRIYYNNMTDGAHCYSLFNTWEEAMNAGLLQSLKLINY